MSNLIPFEPRKLSLQQLVHQKTQVIQHIIQNDGELSPEDEHLLNIANQLIEKKIDGVCVFVKKIIPAAYEALEEAYAAQKSKIERTEEWMDDLVKQAINMDGVNKIDGVMWRVRLQPNPTSAEIVNENEIPDFLKTREMNVNIKIPFGHESYDRILALLDQVQAIAKDVGGEMAIKSNEAKINRKELTSMLKENEEMTIPGAKMPEKTYHVRYEPGKSDIGSVAKKGKKKKEIEATNAEQ